MVRFGVLGAARIAPLALVRPARELPDVEVVAIAAGKHVLCEKPMTANEAEARDVADAADAAFAERGLVVAEAFHHRYHPLTERMREIVHGLDGRPGGGELGAVRRVEAALGFPLPVPSDIRYRYDLAGGALMDVGCYTVHLVRMLAGEEPRVTSARAETLRRDRRVDRTAAAELAFPGGATGRIRASLWGWPPMLLHVRVVGEDGTLFVRNPTQPQPRLPHEVRVRTGRGSRRERVTGDTTYLHQLRAFRDAVRDGTPVLTPARDAVATMRVLDEAYRAAGLPVRGT